MRTIDTHEPAESKHALRDTLTALNPLEMWRAWQEAADQVCLMDAVPPRRRDRVSNETSAN
jgi:hypothetical protein